MTHRLLSCLIALTFVLSSTGPMLAAQPPQQPPVSPVAAVPTQDAVSQALRGNPVTSIQNTGRLDPRVRFLGDSDFGRVAPDLVSGFYDDEFSAGTLDSKWHWVRQDPAHWSLTASPGYLRIVTQPNKDIYQNNNTAPLLLQAAPSGNFEVTTRVMMSPSYNYQQAGIILYEGDDDYVRLTYAYINSPWFTKGRAFQFGQEVNAIFQDQNYILPAPPASSFYLRILKYGQNYIGYYSQDGMQWTEVGEHRGVEITPHQMGLTGFNASGVTQEIPADFDFFHVRTIYTVSGQVVDGGGIGIPNFTILTGSGGSATTDGDGAYTISGLAAGTYTLTPSKSGYTFSPTSRTVSVPPNATGQDFVGTPAAVSIDAVEVTQGIQCLNDANCFGASHTAWCTTADCTNTVPLVVNKPTFVRVYVRSQQEGTRVTALLKGYYQDGQNLPGSPLLSPSVISAHVDGGDCGRTGDSINFRLPAAWMLQDNVTLEPHLYLAGGGSAVDSRQLALAFLDRSAMPVFSWRFRYPSAAAATDTEVRTATQFAAQTYPISADAIDLRDQGEFATNARTWSQLTAQLAKSCDDAKRRSGYAEARCYGWVPQGVTIQSSDGHTYYGWTANGVSVGYVYRSPLAGGVENLAPQYIFAHEIGHTFGPVAHVATAICGGAGGGQFETQFPNTSGSIGQYGFYDGQVYQPSVVLPDHPISYFDLMSYCGVNSNRQWISPYTYRHLFDALGSPDLAWAASAPAASQPYLVVSGVITPTVAAAINSIYSEEYPIGSYDGQGSGPYRLELQDSQGAVLFTRYFNQSSPEWPDPATAPVDFFEIMPFAAGTAKLVVKQDTASLVEVAASANAPQVTLLEPASGPVAGETLQISWTADDADDDQLMFAVEYSTDNGGTWQTLAFDHNETSLTVKTADLPGSSQAKVRVLASDGFNTTTAESGVLEVPAKAPQVTIIAPAQGAMLTPGQPVHLSGIAEDREDGHLDGAAVTWTLDGTTAIGTGTQLAWLDPPAGQHTITLAAQDSTGITTSTSVDAFVGLQETTFPVSITVAAPSVTLIWDHTTAPITGYSVYRSTNPYFMPGSDDAQLMAQITPPGLGGQVAYTDNTAFDISNTLYVYVTCGAYSGDTCAMRSTTTGVFNFALTPGTSP